MPQPKYGLPDRIGKLRTHFENAGVEFADEVPTGGSAAERQTVTPEQCIEARRMLGWSRDRLGGASAVPAYFIITYEQTGRAATSYVEGANPEPLESLRRAFEGAGIEFVTGRKPGVRVRKLKP